MNRSQIFWISFFVGLCLLVQLNILNSPQLALSPAFSFSLRQDEKVLRLAPAKAVEIVPLEQLTLMGAQGKTVSVRDGVGREYVNVAATPVVTFTVGGALGAHSVTVLNSKGQEVNKLTFQVNAQTKLNDGGHFGELFNLLYRGMLVYSPDGTGSVLPPGDCRKLGRKRNQIAQNRSWVRRGPEGGRARAGEG